MISTHALREEGDAGSCGCITARWIFLPTPSARRATPAAGGFPLDRQNFYPRPPRGGRRDGPGPIVRPKDDFYPRPPRGGRPDGLVVDDGPVADFYPRPPRGGRPRLSTGRVTVPPFLPTPSARRATCRQGQRRQDGRISTHALREEGDIEPDVYRRVGLISTHALREEGDRRSQ